MDAIKQYDEEVLAYSFSQGLPELINSFINYFKTYDIDFEEDEILITNGGSEAISFALLAIMDLGDEILIPEPFYTNYNSFSNSAGINIVPITTKAKDGFKLPNKESIQKLVTSKTKAILLSNPGN